MKVLISQATIVDSASPLNGTIQDILIDNGTIVSIKNKITEPADQRIEAAGLHVSIGWMDVFAHFCDPGFEYRETLETGANAAAAGGFTDVMVVPNTQPAIHSKSQVEYILQKSASLPVTIHPIGAITKNTEGKELAEMYDMKNSGAVAFSDGLNALQAPDVLLKALQYVLPFNGTVIQLADNKSIQPHGLMNESITSTQLGLAGKPAFAEEILIAREIELVRYTGSSLHITGISTAKGIELVQKAKTEGLHISCSVTPYHLHFTEENLHQYDTNLKVNPPLRTVADRKALQEAFKNGQIDAIASHHQPQNVDGKICEFEYAKNGMIGLETLFGVLGYLLDDQFTIQDLIHQLTINPRKIFNIPLPAIQEGANASLTLFNPTLMHSLTEADIQSKSGNSPFIHQPLKGKVSGIIHGKTVFLNK